MKVLRVNLFLVTSVLLGLVVVSSCSTSSKKNETCLKHENQTESGFFNRGLVLACQKNDSKAKSAFLKSCQSNYAPGCTRLGYLEEKADNFFMAKDLYNKGCRLGDKLSCDNKIRLSKTQHPYVGKMMNYLSRFDGNITNCYSLHFSKLNKAQSEMQLDKKIQLLKYGLTISKKGKAKRIRIKSKLGEDFNQCVVEVLQGIQFKKPPKTVIAKLDKSVTFH
ncbi:MAG: hypothetical protein KC493_03710 [Bacteriovoracaceae bacterium]|nr:hypothetical protein [Bacteriovoracaceae bacterium]